jgi:regulator of PEP synthase PpsR (kinase-PPPase family)
LNYANSIFQRFPKWQMIHVADKPIEEIAAEILGIMKKRKGSKDK